MSVAVGLKPTRSESRHWDIVKGLVVGEEGTDGAEGSFMQSSYHLRDRSIVRQMSRQLKFSALSSIAQPCVVPDAPYAMPQLSTCSTDQQQSMMSMPSYRLNKSTGRNHAICTELKPDLWKVLYNSIKAHGKV